MRKPSKPFGHPDDQRSGSPPGRAMAPGRGEDLMSEELTQWIALDSWLGRSWLGSTGNYSTPQLRERAHALRTAVEWQKIVMRNPHTIPRCEPADQALIMARMTVRLDEAMRMEQALRNRAASGAAGTEWNEKEKTGVTRTDEPALRESALYLQSTEELLQRLSDLRRALHAPRLQHETDHLAGIDHGVGASMQASMARYRQQADAVVGILRKRGVATR